MENFTIHYQRMRMEKDKGCHSIMHIVLTFWTPWKYLENTQWSPDHISRTIDAEDIIVIEDKLYALGTIKSVYRMQKKCNLQIG